MLLAGRGEPLDAALRVALERHDLFVEEAFGELRSVTKMTAPDLVVLIGDAARDGGRAALEELALDPLTATTPVAVLGAPEAFDARLLAFRHGAVAVIPRLASVDAIASTIASVVGDLADRGQPAEVLGEATLDDLVSLVGRELRNGLLSVEPADRHHREGQPLRIVLGAGRPVAEAVEEFVKKLAPLVSRAEPLVYELHQGPGGAIALLDGEGEARADARVFDGLRVLLIDSDPSRADTLAQALRARNASVVVVGTGGAGLERAREIDPDVVLVDAAGLEGEGFEVIRRIRADHRLRWASLLVVPWEELWPTPAGLPDVERLAEQLEPLVVPDRSLRERARAEQAFETRLEATGPSRLLRVLASLEGPFHATVRSAKALVEVDLADGLVVGATATTATGERLEAARALAALLGLGSGRVRIEQRPHAATANLMSPIAQAIALAEREEPPVPLTVPPPMAHAVASLAKDARGARSSDESGPFRPVGGPRTRARPQTGRVADRDLRWGDEKASGAAPREGVVLAPPVERTLEVEIPSVPPGVARSSLPTGIVSTVSDGSVMAPLPRPAAAARKTAFAGAPSPSARGASRAPSPNPSEDLKVTARPGEVARPIVAAPARAIPSGAFGSSAGQSAAPPPDARSEASPPIDRRPARSSRAPAKGTMTFGSAAPASSAPVSVRQRPARHTPTALGMVGPLASASVGASVPGVIPARAQGASAPTPTPSAATRAEVVATAADEDPSLALLDEGAPALPEVLREGLPELPAPDDAPERGHAATQPIASSAGDERSSALADVAHASEPTASPRAPERSGELAPSSHAPPIAAPAWLVAEPAPAASPAPSGAPPLASAAIPTSAPPRSRRGRALGLAALAALLLGVVGVVAAAALVLYGVIPGRERLLEGAPALLDLLGATPTSEGGERAEPPSGALTRPRAELAANPPTPTAAEASEAAATPEAGARAADEGERGEEASGEPPSETAPSETAPSETAPSETAPSETAPSETAPSETPPPTAEPLETNAEALLRRAEASRDDAERERLYRRALELEPHDHYAMIGLAEVLLRTGRPDAAIPLIEGAIQRRRRRPEYRVLLGDAQRAAGNAAEATRAYRDALELDPQNRAARARLAE